MASPLIAYSSGTDSSAFLCIMDPGDYTEPKWTIQDNLSQNQQISKYDFIFYLNSHLPSNLTYAKVASIRTGAFFLEAIVLPTTNRHRYTPL